MSGYNITRSAEELLDKYESFPPSFSVYLYPDHWTLNGGPKFLYNNPVASFLDDVRAHRIPVDFLELFDSARVPFYDGCMVVELLDYRPKRAKDPPLEKPECSRVTLHPSDETLWADLCLINQRNGSKFTDLDALELEARILLHTAPPLCLDPDPYLTRIANHTLRVSTPTIPTSLKRKSAASTPEEDESDKARRAKIMHFMNPRLTRSHSPSYRILETLRRVREARSAEAHVHVTQLANGPLSSAPLPQPHVSQPLPPPTSHTLPPTSSSQAGVDPPQARQLKKSESQPLPISPENTRSTATPAPHPAINQLQAQLPTRSPPVNSRSPLPANPYQVPAGTTMVAPSPAQRGYTQSPRPPSAQATHSSPLASGSQIPVVDRRQPPAGMHFIQVAPGASQSKPATPQVGYSSLPTPSPQQAVIQQATHIPQPTPQPQPQPSHPTMPTNIPVMYAHHLQHFNQAQVLQAQAQVRAQNGRVTPQNRALPRSPMISAPTTAVRNSPVVQNQPLTARSPMPNTTSLPQQMTQPTMAQPTMTQPAQHPAMATAPAYNYTSFRPIAHAATQQHPQVQVHMQRAQPNVAVPQVSDAQQAMMMQYPMYHPYYQVAHDRRMQPSYAWTGMGRGMPNQVNGQTPGMQPGLPQQIQVAQGKTTQAGVPGR
ncbi:Spt20 family-domain-containing protein [Scleroderma yunnanense]